MKATANDTRKFTLAGGARCFRDPRDCFLIKTSQFARLMFFSKNSFNWGRIFFIPRGILAKKEPVGFLRQLIMFDEYTSRYLEIEMILIPSTMKYLFFEVNM